MGRSQESFHKKEVRSKKEKKRKEKEKKRLARKEEGKSGSMDDLIAYVDENGMIVDTPPDPSEKKEETKLEDIEISVPKKENQEDFDPVKKGIVSFFNDSKGYGFIKDLETQQSIFVHINNVSGEIREGNTVSFEVEMGPKGPSAIKVELVK